MKTIKKTVISLIMIIALIGLINSLVITSEGEYTVLTQFGEIVAVIKQPGLSFKIPFIQKSKVIFKNERIYDLNSSDVITKDKKSMVADCFALWRVEDPKLFLSAVDGSDVVAQSRIDAIVYNSLKNVISRTEQKDVVSGRDGALTDAILKNIGDSLMTYGIKLESVEIKLLDLPDANEGAVYERMISERNNIAASFTANGESEAKKIRNKADAEADVLLSEAQAEASKLIAEGESEYMRILSSAYNSQDKASFYEFIIAMDTAKNSLANNNNILIVDPDSPIAKIFNP